MLVGCGKNQDQIDAENRAVELQEENNILRNSIDETRQQIDDARQHINDANDALEQRRLNAAGDELDSARNSINE